MTGDEANPEIRRDRYTGIVLAGRYEVGGLIARDAVTETHLAQDRELGATVAIKFLSPQLAEDLAFAERFVAEALAATVVRGPKIISILDAGTSEGMRYVVQEHVEGQTLGQKLRNDGKVYPDTACEVMDQVLGALTEAHEAGIIHGHVDPSNIIFTGPASVKLLDLGIARVGIRTGTITEDVNRHNAEGTVIAQDPVAGTIVTPGMEVNLTVAMARELRASGGHRAMHPPRQTG